MVDILFYWFSSLLIFSAAVTVLTKNIRYSILFVTVVTMSSSALMFLIGAGVFAFFSIILYSGMVGILLFFVFAFNLNKEIDKSFGSRRNVLVSVATFVFLIVTLVGIYFSFKEKKIVLMSANKKFSLDGVNILLQKISFLLFGTYSYVLEICGVILFVGIIASIVLLFKKKGITQRHIRHASKGAVADDR